MRSTHRTAFRTKVFTATSTLSILAAAATETAKLPPPAIDEEKREEVPPQRRPPVRARVSREERSRLIAQAAYRRAELAGFANSAVDNWLSAERDVDAQIDRIAS